VASPVISLPSRPPRRLPIRESQQPVFLLRFRKSLPTSRSGVILPIQDVTVQPRDPLHVCFFNLFLSPSPSSPLQEIDPHSQPQLERAGLSPGFFDCVSLQWYNSCGLSDCIFSPKLRRAELPMQAHRKHSPRKHVYVVSFNSIFPFIGRHPATIRKSLKSQLDASSL
jgi:hypothetical protein